MTGLPQVDLSSEMSFAFQDYLIIALVIAAALAFLFRGLWRRRGRKRGDVAACSSCSGCGTGAPCHLPQADLSRPSESSAGKRKSSGE